MTEEIKRLKNALDSADSVIIGAGAGLSTLAEFNFYRIKHYARSKK